MAAKILSYPAGLGAGNGHHDLAPSAFRAGANGAAQPERMLGALRGGARRGAALVGVWMERSRERRRLMEMSDHMLSDIGLSPGDAMHEYRKPFWRG